MGNDQKQHLIKMINESSEKELAGLLETALKMHLANLLKQQKQIEQEIAKTKKKLGQISPAPKKPARKRRSGPRVADVIRQTLKAAAGPLPLNNIAKAVAKATNRPLTDSLRSYVSQLIKLEPAIRRLSRGLYGISI